MPRSACGVSIVESGNGGFSVQVSAPTLNLKPDRVSSEHSTPDTRPLSSTLFPRHFHPTATILRLRKAIWVGAARKPALNISSKNHFT
jgi:hypothetical protein